MFSRIENVYENLVRGSRNHLRSNGPVSHSRHSFSLNPIVAWAVASFSSGPTSTSPPLSAAWAVTATSWRTFPSRSATCPDGTKIVIP